jgi:hypothetical protein
MFGTVLTWNGWIPGASITYWVCSAIIRTPIAGLSPRRFGFDLRPVHVRFMLDKVAMGRVFLLPFRFSLVNIIPLLLHLRVALTRTTNWRSLGNFQKQCSFRDQGALDRKVHPLFFGG